MKDVKLLKLTLRLMQEIKHQAYLTILKMD